MAQKMSSRENRELNKELMSWLRDSRARHGVSQVPAKVVPTSDGSGPTPSASSKTAEQVCLSLNAPQTCGAGGFRSSSTTLPASGGMRSGALIQRPKREHPTVGRGSSWSRGMFPTPTASRYGSSQNGCNGKGGAFERPSAGTPSLDTWARQWPTPTASDSRSSGRHTTTTGVMHPGTSLTDAMRGWATPTARDHKSTRASAATHSRNSRPLSEQVGEWAGRRDQTTSTGGESTSQPVVLNPEFLEALMGLPTGWTECGS